MLRNRHYSLPDTIDSLRVEGTTRVIITQGTENSLRICAEEDFLEDIVDPKATGNTLILKTTSSGSTTSSLPNYERIIYYLTLKSLEKVVVLDAKVHIPEEVRLKKIILNISGNGDVLFQREGSVEEQMITLSEYSSYGGASLISKKTTLIMTGKSHAYVHVTESFEFTALDTARCVYFGQPSNIRSKQLDIDFSNR